MWSAANSNMRTNQSIRKESNFTKRPWQEMTKEASCTSKHAKQQNEYYSTHSLNFSQKKCSDVTPFDIMNIFKSNCNWITHSFFVTVTDYIYFVIKLCNFITCNCSSPTLDVSYYACAQLQLLLWSTSGGRCADD